MYDCAGGGWTPCSRAAPVSRRCPRGQLPPCPPTGHETSCSRATAAAVSRRPVWKHARAARSKAPRDPHAPAPLPPTFLPLAGNCRASPRVPARLSLVVGRPRGATRLQCPLLFDPATLRPASARCWDMSTAPPLEPGLCRSCWFLSLVATPSARRACSVYQVSRTTGLPLGRDARLNAQSTRQHRWNANCSRWRPVHWCVVVSQLVTRRDTTCGCFNGLRHRVWSKIRPLVSLLQRETRSCSGGNGGKRPAKMSAAERCDWWAAKSPPPRSF